MATIKTVDTGNKAAEKIEIDDTILETPYHKKNNRILRSRTEDLS